MKLQLELKIKKVTQNKPSFKMEEESEMMPMEGRSIHCSLLQAVSISDQIDHK